MGTNWGTLHPDDPCGRVPIAMPRQPRLDAPETLHHGMVRGIERRPLAPVLSNSPQPVYAAAQRGAQYRAEGDRLVAKSRRR